MPTRYESRTAVWRHRRQHETLRTWRRRDGGGGGGCDGIEALGLFDDDRNEPVGRHDCARAAVTTETRASLSVRVLRASGGRANGVSQARRRHAYVNASVRERARGLSPQLSWLISARSRV